MLLVYILCIYLNLHIIMNSKKSKLMILLHKVIYHIYIYTTLKNNAS